MAPVCCCNMESHTIEDVLGDLRALQQSIQSASAGSPVVEQNSNCRCNPCICPSDTLPCNDNITDNDLSDEGLLKRLSGLIRQAQEIATVQQGACNCARWSPERDSVAPQEQDGCSPVTTANPNPQLHIPMKDYALYKLGEPPFDNQVHRIMVEVRLPSRLGGDDNGPILRFEDVKNDTGSERGTLFRRDWDMLNVEKIRTYGLVMQGSWNGRRETKLEVNHEIRLVQWYNGSLFAISNWLEEKSVIVDQDRSGDIITDRQFSRLSGSAIRRHLFFLTPPIWYDNDSEDTLFVSQSRESMIQALQSHVTAVVRQRPQQDLPMLDHAHYLAPGDNVAAHNIQVQIRLPGPPKGAYGEQVIELDGLMNDTGAMIGCLFASDWARLDPGNTRSSTSYAYSADARGEEVKKASHETRLVKRTNEGLFAVSDWMADESIIVKDPEPNGHNKRICGYAMRQYLYLLTPPSDMNNNLYVARSKETMIQILQSL